MKHFLFLRYMDHMESVLILYLKHYLQKTKCKTDAINAWKMNCPSADLPSNLFSQRQWDGPLCQNMIFGCYIIGRSFVSTMSHNKCRCMSITFYTNMFVDEKLQIYLFSFDYGNLGQILLVKK